MNFGIEKLTASNILLRDSKKDTNNRNTKEYVKISNKESKLKNNRKNKKDKMSKIKQILNTWNFLKNI